MSRRRKSSNAFSLFSFQDIITSVTGIMLLVTLMLALELIRRKEESPPQQTAELTEQLKSTLAENRQQIDQLSRQLKQQGEEAVELAGVDPQNLKRRIQDTSQVANDLQDEVSQLQQQQDKTRRRLEDIRNKQSQQSLDERLQQIQQQLAEKREELEKLKQSNRMIFNPDPGSSKSPWLVEIVGDSIKAAPVGQSAQPVTFASLAEFQRWSNARDPGGEYFVLLVKPTGITKFQQVRDFLQKNQFDVGYDLLAPDQTAIDPDTGAGAP